LHFSYKNIYISTNDYLLLFPFYLCTRNTAFQAKTFSLKELIYICIIFSILGKKQKIHTFVKIFLSDIVGIFLYFSFYCDEKNTTKRVIQTMAGKISNKRSYFCEYCAYVRRSDSVRINLRRMTRIRCLQVVKQR
jgi:hypothetical protein